MTPAKAIARLRRLAEDWRREEARLCEQFGDVIAPQSMRARQIKDTQAIDEAVEMIDRLEAAEQTVQDYLRIDREKTQIAQRLEAAEKTNREWLRANAPGGWIDNLRVENEALRAEVIHIKEVEFPRKAQAVADGWRGKCERLEAKIEAMERQEPVAFALYSGWSFKAAYHKEHEACDQRDRRQLSADLGGSLEAYRVVPLYPLPGAQPEPSEQDASVRKAWARFSHELHRSPDAPYPGMADAFEQHFSQSFTDREWRAEASTWAAAWKAAKHHGAQPAPSVPEGWLHHAARMAALARKLREPDWDFESIREMQHELCALEEAALAAAPEAKP